MYSRGSSPDGLQYKCRRCFRAYYISRRPAPTRTPQTIEERTAKERARRLANRDKKAAYDRARRAEKADQIKEDKRRYYLKHREEWIQKTTAYRKAHPDAYRAYMRKGQAVRRARLLAQFVEHVDPLEVWRRDAGTCHICGLAADPQDWHLEHVVALSRGGEHSYANTAVAHPVCNLRKGARETWAATPATLTT